MIYVVLSRGAKKESKKIMYSNVTLNPNTNQQEAYCKTLLSYCPQNVYH